MNQPRLLLKLLDEKDSQFPVTGVAVAHVSCPTVLLVATSVLLQVAASGGPR